MFQGYSPAVFFTKFLVQICAQSGSRSRSGSLFYCQQGLFA